MSRVPDINNNLNLYSNKSKSLSDESKNHFYWKYNSFTLEKLSEVDYKSIDYENKYNKSKICGKDSYGNNLYFQKYVIYPINDIIIMKHENFDIKGKYIKLKLKKNLFLYYSSKKIDIKIITDLTKNEPKLHLKGRDEASEYKNVEYKPYSKIESNNYIYLSSNHYLRMNREILGETKK